MADQNHDELDHALDAALAKYAAVEPRAGLEERVLANWRTAPAQTADRMWWPWSARWGVVAAVAVVVVAITLAWRVGKPSHSVVADHPSPATQGLLPATQVVSNGHEDGVHVHAAHHLQATTRQRALPVVAAAPRLDQFPSPRPLSDQERILASYVLEFHAQAVLIARVANEERQQDRKKMLGETQSPAGFVERPD